jgi:hypothetical protein
MRRSSPPSALAMIVVLAFVVIGIALLSVFLAGVAQDLVR